MLTHSQLYSRRHFLTNSLAACTTLGSGLVISGNLLADRIELAARISETQESHPLIPALKLASESLQALEKISDYQATFTKSELIGRNLVNTRMELKLRENPFSVYVKFLQPHAGREAIYVHGQNKNYLQVHETGFASLAGTLSLDPKGSTAMEDNRYPITSIGMRNLLTKLVETWLAERPLSGMSVNIFPNGHLGDRTCQVVEVSHRQHHHAAKFQVTRLYLDNENNLPIRVQAFDFPGKKDKSAVLAEDYMYSSLSTNIGLTDNDFSTKNPKYRF